MLPLLRVLARSAAPQNGSAPARSWPLRTADALNVHFHAARREAHHLCRRCPDDVGYLPADQLLDSLVRSIIALQVHLGHFKATVGGDIFDVENHRASMCSAYLVDGTASELRAEVATNSGEDPIANVVAHAGGPFASAPDAATGTIVGRPEKVGWRRV
jgi:hypothetical protein